MKKAQMNAAVLVTIISALIVMYIMFLPSEDRLEFVGENVTYRDGGKIVNGDEIIIEEEELVMEHIGEKEIEHDLPSVNLYTSKAAREIFEENAVYVKNGVFDKADRTVEFKLSEPDNVDNVLISFFAKTSKGRLKISVNGFEIYNNVVSTVNVRPISIPKDYLAERNTVIIETSSVGFAFWTTNEYLLENFKVTADITDTSTRESVLRFVIPREEASNIEKAKLRFVPECQPNNVGVLDILVNNHVIYSSVPDCGTPRPLDFAPANIVTGENKLSFRSERGRYLIDQIRITTELEDQPSYTFYFDMDEDDWKDLQDEEINVNLTMWFTDDNEDKEAEIIINSRKLFMTRHDDFEWSALLNRYVEEGSNSLKIVPETRLEIRKFVVKLDDE